MADISGIAVEEDDVMLLPTGGSCWHICVPGWTGNIGSITMSREDAGVVRLGVELRQIIRGLNLGRVLHQLCRQLQMADPAIEAFVAGPAHVLRQGPVIRALKSGGFRCSGLSEDRRFWEGRFTVNHQDGSTTWEERHAKRRYEHLRMGSC